MKKVLRKAGADGQPVVFLFNDLQIKDEAFLEDLSMVLSTGEASLDQSLTDCSIITDVDIS